MDVKTCVIIMGAFRDIPHFFLGYDGAILVYVWKVRISFL